MKKRSLLLLTLSLMLLAIACGFPAAAPDTQATVDAAVAATAGAQAALQAAVATSVAATAASIQLTEAPPTPTPGPTVEYVTLTEEELAALVDQAVAEAAAAAAQASTTSTAATSDNAVTAEEVQAVEVYVAGAEAAITYAEEILAAYEDLYGQLATETVALLGELEAGLQSLAANTAAINATLQEISSTLASGVALAEETINQLESMAQETSGQAAEIQAQAQSFAVQAQASREGRAAAALNLTAEQVAGDLPAALQSAFDYLDVVRVALKDGRLSAEELGMIAQFGANASASLKARSGAKFQALSRQIDTITAQLARGQVPQARAGLGNFEASLGTRPGRAGGGVRP